MSDQPIPDPAVVVLAGAAGSGKSTWALARYRSAEIVSSDLLRSVVGSGPADLDATVDAFALLDQILLARTRRGLTTVVDTLGLEPARRRGYLEAARQAGLPAVLVLIDTPAALCRTRNAERDRPVPAPALTAQLRRIRQLPTEIADEGWDLVLTQMPGDVGTPSPSSLPRQPLAVAAPDDPIGLRGVVLQVSRFPWGADPAGWLREIASAAAQSGFRGLALMDHLVQIPQVGRAWDPIPEPWVSLGLLAGATTELRLGTLVSPVTFRPPGMLAKTVATLDVLSGGRAFCGLGAGWWDREHAGFGLPFPPVGERMALLEKTIETVRALWAPGTKAFHGAHVELPDTTCYPRPVGTVPIIVGGSGPRRTLRIAAELADGCNLPADLDGLVRGVTVLREHCARIGRSPDEVAVTVLDVPVVGTDREQTASLVDRLRGRTAATTFARRHHAGTVAEHIERYHRLADHGVSTVFLSLPDLAGPQDVERCAPLAAAFG